MGADGKAFAADPNLENGMMTASFSLSGRRKKIDDLTELDIECRPNRFRNKIPITIDGLDNPLRLCLTV